MRARSSAESADQSADIASPEAIGAVVAIDCEGRADADDNLFEDTTPGAGSPTITTGEVRVLMSRVPSLADFANEDEAMTLRIVAALGEPESIKVRGGVRLDRIQFLRWLAAVRDAGGTLAAPDLGWIEWNSFHRRLHQIPAWGGITMDGFMRASSEKRAPADFRSRLNARGRPVREWRAVEILRFLGGEERRYAADMQRQRAEKRAAEWRGRGLP